jgi:hypothetical protein
MNDYLTYSTGDIRYVKNHWDYANMILITDDQGNVVLKTPPPLQIQSD